MTIKIGPVGPIFYCHNDCWESNERSEWVNLAEALARWLWACKVKQKARQVSCQDSPNLWFGSCLRPSPPFFRTQVKMPGFFYFQRFRPINPAVARLQRLFKYHFTPISDYLRPLKLGMKQEVFCMNWGWNRRTSTPLNQARVSRVDKIMPKGLRCRSGRGEL